MTRRITASHPDYPAIDRHQRMLCIMVNAGCHFNTRGLTLEMPAPEYAALGADIVHGLDAMLEGGAFRDWWESKGE